MEFSKLSLALILSSLLFLTSSSSSAANPKKSYIVLLGSHSHGGLDVSEADLHRVAESHYQLLGSFLGSKKKAIDVIFYSYKNHINGFGAMLDEEEATELAKHPEVAVVLPNKAVPLHTTHSWGFMHLERNGTVPSSTWKRARFGEDAIIATLDTGVWPESMSFRDDGINGPIPSRWKGSCENSSNDGFHCNRKLIGAKYFNKGYYAYMRSEVPWFDLSSVANSTRDYEGHGSHTLSTAGGNFVPAKNVFGSSGFGSAKGGSPKARVAAYKVCWPHANCPWADLFKGMDEAIHDGVDVLSLSLGGTSSDYYQDGFAIATFHAVKNGITVVASAANSGPRPGTVVSVAPWILTVGASTLDRRFQAIVQLGNGQGFQGSSLSKELPEQKYYPLITGAQATAMGAYPEDAILCKPGSLDPAKVKGKILVCLIGETGRIDKGQQAAMAGAVGMILCNDGQYGDQISHDIHVLPTSHIGFEDGRALFSYMEYTENPMAYLAPPEEKFDLKPAPTMAAFSARGPNMVTPEIIKPDVTAPGVDLIAAYTQAKSPDDDPSSNFRSPYITMSGTSMSCPTVAGIVGLLKTLHPDWSPAAIKSAIMTSARVRDNTRQPMLDEGSGRQAPAGPFSYGSGHVQPNGAMDPGLVYDLTTEDYLDFLCAHGYDSGMMSAFSDGPYQCPASASLTNFNYPSIGVQNLKGKVTVTRRLKNVGSPGTYKASVRLPKGVSVSVQPRVLKFDKVGEEKSFNVTLSGSVSQNAVVDGTLIWSDGKHFVRSPIVVSSGSFYSP